MVFKEIMPINYRINNKKNKRIKDQILLMIRYNSQIINSQRFNNQINKLKKNLSR